MADDALEDDKPEDIPLAIINKPDLDPFLESVLEAYFLLNQGRTMSIGMGVSRTFGIPACDVIRVAEAHGFDPLYFLRMTRALDAVYLEAANKT